MNVPPVIHPPNLRGSSLVFKFGRWLGSHPLAALLLMVGVVAALGAIAFSSGNTAPPAADIKPAADPQIGAEQAAAATPITADAPQEQELSTAEQIRIGMAKREDSVYYAARDAVKRMLKSPSTAKFSVPGVDLGTGVWPYGFYQWQASGWVDAKNSFNTTVREQWRAVVRLEDGAMKFVYFRLGNEEEGKDPGVRPAPPAAPRPAPRPSSATNPPAAAVGK